MFELEDFIAQLVQEIQGWYEALDLKNIRDIYETQTGQGVPADMHDSGVVWATTYDLVIESIISKLQEML